MRGRAAAPGGPPITSASEYATVGGRRAVIARENRLIRKRFQGNALHEKSHNVQLYNEDTLPGGNTEPGATPVGPADSGGWKPIPGMTGSFGLSLEINPLVSAFIIAGAGAPCKSFGSFPFSPDLGACNKNALTSDIESPGSEGRTSLDCGASAMINYFMPNATSRSQSSNGSRDQTHKSRRENNHEAQIN